MLRNQYLVLFDKKIHLNGRGELTFAVKMEDYSDKLLRDEYCVREKGDLEGIVWVFKTDEWNVLINSSYIRKHKGLADSANKPVNTNLLDRPFTTDEIYEELEKNYETFESY